MTVAPAYLDRVAVAGNPVDARVGFAGGHRWLFSNIPA